MAHQQPPEQLLLVRLRVMLRFDTNNGDFALNSVNALRATMWGYTFSTDIVSLRKRIALRALISMENVATRRFCP